MRRSLLLALALFISGCATFNQREIAYFRTAGVPPPLIARLEHGRPLSPGDITTLARLKVPDRFILRHLEDNGVNYLVTKRDILHMRAAGVSARVIDALLAECADFARRYSEPPVDVSLGFWWMDYPYYGPGFYADPWW